jgi:outer membrane lipoprotein carrier protein
MKFATLLVASVVAHPLAAQDAVPVLETAESAYDKIVTLKAEFTQTIINPMLGGPEESQGTLYLSPPDRFSMRFNDPEGDRIVADGTWLWLFTPSTVPDQVIRQTIPSSGAATPNLFAQFVHRPLERYDATYVGADSVAGIPADRVRLIPRVDGIPFRQAVISVSRRDGIMRKVALVEESGQRRSLVFNSIEINRPIPAAELIFRPPDGTRIVTP